MKGIAIPRVMFSNLTSAEFMKQPKNEPILEYGPGSEERRALDEAVKNYAGRTTQVPVVVGDKEIHGDTPLYQTWPSNHGKKLAQYSYASKAVINEAIDRGLKARKEWEGRSLEKRMDVFLRAADLAAGKYRMDLMATTMLGQGKTIVQAEIDAAAELVDFLRFNAFFGSKLEKYEPISTQTVTNRMEYRGLEGFVAAISPFNFTAIGGNLASCPAMMGNTVMWKPSDTAVLSNYVTYKIFREAGLPADVIQFLPADGPSFGEVICGRKELAAINFTGSVPTFKHLWRAVAKNLDLYDTFPRLVGECGGKNFHFVHPSADLDTVAATTVRGAFEYSGQKCSATSRMYVPSSKWPELRDKMISHVKGLHLGGVRELVKTVYQYSGRKGQKTAGILHIFQPEEGGSFLSAVIDRKAFQRIKGYLDLAREGKDARILVGGKCEDSVGYFVEPTILETTDPKSKLMSEEIFGPVLTVYPYEDGKCEETLRSVKGATPFGLTGSIYSQDKSFLAAARGELRDAVGNMYLNDKSTGSIVGQQPFGGARMSGTNDKAGGPHYCLKWVSPLTIKETKVPLTDIAYPSMD